MGCGASAESKAAATEGAAVITKHNHVYTFPEGAAGVLIKNEDFGSSAEKFVAQAPPRLNEIIKKKGCEGEFKEFAEAIASKDSHWFGALDNKQVNEEVGKFVPKFDAKGVAMHMCSKAEMKRREDAIKKLDQNRWVVFVDKDVLPDYKPDQAWDGNESCSVM